MTTPTTEPKPKCGARVSGVGGTLYRCDNDAADCGVGPHKWRLVPDTAPRPRPTERVKVQDGFTVRESWDYDGFTHGCTALHRNITVCRLPMGARVNGEPVVTSVFRSSITCPACLKRIEAERLDLPGDKC